MQNQTRQNRSLSDHDHQIIQDIVDGFSHVPKDWVSTCLREHSLPCLSDSKSSDFIPTRLIDIGLPAGLEPCLRDTRDHKIPKSKYVALSHRWGTPDTETYESMTTTTSSLPARLLCIPLSSLPKSFKEAIIVCYYLGVQFLWIDSLCILQDSAEDWERESRTMAQIYENAFITVALNVSNDSTQSLLLSPKRDNSILGWHQKLNKAWGIGKAEIWWNSLLEGGPLGSRAWCYQERYLSTRLIHITDNGIWLWECNSRTFWTVGTESHGRRPSMQRHNPRQLWQQLNHDDVTTLGQERKVAEILYQWHQIVETYSKRKLTLETDKLPALSGLAHKMHDLTESPYLAGIWIDDLSRGLLWQRNQKTNLEQWRRPAEYRAPSWSWCAIDGPVQLQPIVHKVQFKLLSTSIVPARNDPIGQLQIGSKICLSGRLRKFQVTKPDPWKIGQSILDTSEMVKLHKASPAGYGTLCWDIPTESGAQEVWCLAIGTDSYAQYGLALTHTTVQPDEFQRIGKITFVGLTWFNVSDEDRSITIV